MKLFKFIILFSFLLITNNLFSQVLNGLIVDQNGEPLEQVSIYLKNNPVYGSATSSDGNFKIDFDEAKLKNRDEIVFSYIGYKTVYIKVSDLRWDTLKVTLIEQPIVLNEASIKAKVSKKQLNKIKENQLMRLKKQLEQDFPNKDTVYNIASSITVVNDGSTLFSNDLFGVLKELSKQSAKGKDSIGIDVNSVRDYLNKNIIMGIENMKDNPLELKKDKWKVDSTFFDILSTDQEEINKRSIELHKSLWQMNPCAKIVVDDLEYDPKDWEIEEMDNMLLFTYMNKAGFLGIVKYRSFLTLYVNPQDYKLHKLEERVNAQVNIPIGVKLKGDMLRLLNVINFGEKDFEKFRLRHAKIDLVRNVLYNEGLSTNLPLEKNVIVYMQLEDNRKNVLKGKSTAKTIIN